MAESESRRDFLKKMALGGLAMGVPALPADPGRGLSKAILKIKPLGHHWETSDPFLYCVHNEDSFPAGNDAMGPSASLQGRDIGQDFAGRDGWRMYHGRTVPGFPGHPHRGFETVTVVRKGMVDHSDSMGAAGRYGDGDVQWMTAGAGIQHSEMFPLLQMGGGNTLELFQIWLNLPRARKMTTPDFKMLWREDIRQYLAKDTAGRSIEATLIAGELGGVHSPKPPPVSWAADPAHDVAILTLRMQSGASWTLPAAKAGVNRTLYFFAGTGLRIDGESIPAKHSVHLRGDAKVRLQCGTEDCEMLLLQGRPIGEPVAQRGPFVMNTDAEIGQAFEDYRKTRFGGWPWPTHEHVHSREKGRFARHADGTETIRPI